MGDSLSLRERVGVRGIGDGDNAAFSPEVPDITLMDSSSAHRLTPLDPRLAPKRSMFVLEDGRNVVFVFVLLILLFALWGFCNGMIDVMDKHFQ